MDWTIILASVTVGAIIAGPILALYVQRKLDRERAATDRKIAIFRNLMSHRASRLTPAFVEALNAIEVEFFSTDNSTRRVIEAWHDYCEMLYSTDADDPQKNPAWNDKCTDHVNALLLEMGDYLGYHFDKQTLKRMVYYPRGWGENELDALTLRKAAVDVFTGKKPLKMQIDGAIELANDPFAPQAPPQVQPQLPPAPRAKGIAGPE